ncbi:MAG: hypothetical protein MJ177_07100 [Clostridia bacterium]|nr:hypothetical protein [Clostridia bacterium]
MKQSSKTALCGMTAALGVVIMLLSTLPLFYVAAPAFPGMLTMLIVIEVDRKWAFGVYAAVALISFFICPDKEAAMLYLAFFGYYPIIKSVFESKLPRAVEILLKFVVFNAAVIAAYYVLSKFMGVDLNEFGEMGSKNLPLKTAIPIVLALANVAFAVLDFCMTSFVTLYIHRFQKYFRKLFKF